MDRIELEAEARRLAAIPGFDVAERTRGLARALEIYRELGDERSECAVLTKLGNVAINTADFPVALDYLHEAEAIALRLCDATLDREVAGQLSFVLSELGDHDAALALTLRGYERDARAEDPEMRLLAINSLGCLLSAAGRHEEGLARIREADTVIPQILDSRRRQHLEAQSTADLSEALLRAGKAREALDAAERGATLAAGIDHSPLVMLNRFYAGRAAHALSDMDLAARRLGEAAAMAARMGQKSQESQARMMLADALAARGEHAQALEAYRAGHGLEREMRREEAARRLQFARSRREIEAAHRERQDAERLLFAVLPPAIAARMKAGQPRIADELADVSILFADLVGFTALSMRTEARSLLDLLDRIFSEFDRLVAQLGLEKIKTIGDAYMAVGGALSDASGHLERSTRLGFGMLEAVDRLGAGDLSIRIGLHAGPAVAGVIGSQRLSYDLWGDAVNLASRLESSGVAGRIHISAAVANRLQGSYRSEPRGSVKLKGMGEVPTFLLARD